MPGGIWPGVGGGLVGKTGLPRGSSTVAEGCCTCCCNWGCTPSASATVYFRTSTGCNWLSGQDYASLDNVLNPERCDNWGSDGDQLIIDPCDGKQCFVWMFFWCPNTEDCVCDYLAQALWVCDEEPTNSVYLTLKEVDCTNGYLWFTGFSPCAGCTINEVRVSLCDGNDPGPAPGTNTICN